MKGMQKIKRGTGFRGVLNYVLDGGKLLGGNMSGDRPVNLTREFAATRRLRGDIEKAVWHNSLRLPKGERLSAEKWVEIADEYMKRMGFSDEHMRCYVLHDEPEGQHIHIVASRISIGSSVYLGRNENLKSTRVISELEEKYGLTQTPSTEIKNDRRRLSRNELAMAEREGGIAPRARLQSILDELLTEPMDVYALIDQLAQRGVSARPNVVKTGRMNGFSFEVEGIAFKASQLGEKYGWTRLQDVVAYEPEQHAEGLREYVASGFDVSMVRKRMVNHEQIRTIEAASEAIRERNDALRESINAARQRESARRARIERIRERLAAAREEQQRITEKIRCTQHGIAGFREGISAFIERITKLIAAILAKQRHAKAVYEQRKEAILSAVNAQLVFLEENPIYCEAVRHDPDGFVRLALAEQLGRIVDAGDSVVYLILKDYQADLLREVDAIQQEHEIELSETDRMSYRLSMRKLAAMHCFDDDIQALDLPREQGVYERDV